MLMHVVALQDHGKPTSLMPGQPFASMHLHGGLMVHASHATMHVGIASRQVAMHQGEREPVNLAKSMIMHVIDALWNCRWSMCSQSCSLGAIACMHACTCIVASCQRSSDHEFSCSLHVHGRSQENHRVREQEGQRVRK